MDPAFFSGDSILDSSMGYPTRSSPKDWDLCDIKQEPDDPAQLCLFTSYPEWQLPQFPSSNSSKEESSSDLIISPMVMASLAATGGTSGTNSKQIPLLCTVCPETPRFSDVSHLLTHIASKGHLHHETQTKLKAHQEISASVALQQYEQWYRENGIEALLVERMKAKQIKEAARNKRSRGVAAPVPLKQPKKKVKRSNNSYVKAESESYSQDFPIFPGFFPSDNEVEAQDEFSITGDMMALKGQVWPGMGKMDLANEDMKRTRNQRKPKSVIERMRRTSEGIEPTQVVMTSEFEVERVKDVYDSSSPIPGQEEATPQKKVTRPRRKKPEPLAEISANVPRGNRRVARGNPVHEKLSKPNLAYSRTPSSEITPTMGQFKRSFDVFRDEDILLDRPLPGSSHREPKFDLHGRLGLRQLNPISHSNLVSPTPSSRDMPGRAFPPRDISCARGQAQPYLGMNGHPVLDSMNHQDLSYGLNESSIYNNSARMPLATHNQFNGLGHDHFHLPSHHPAAHKFEDFANSTSNDSISNTVANQFLNVPANNPLFAHDRLFLGSCSQSDQSSSLSSLGFTPINRHRGSNSSSHTDQDRSCTTNNVKIEPQLCGIMEDSNAEDAKDASFGVDSMWEQHTLEDERGMHDDLGRDELDL